MPRIQALYFMVVLWLRRLGLLVTLPVVFLVIAVLVWERQVVPSDSGAASALTSDERVLVSDLDWLTFSPRSGEPRTGLIFYPGGKVDPLSYAPLLHQIAAAGYLVVLIPMPLNLAILAPNRAQTVEARFPSVSRWIIGGHSLGGTVAAWFVRHHPKMAAGLLLWASYPAPGSDLSRTTIPVLTIYGLLDEQATPEQVEGARVLLPADARLLPLRDGDHWSFGDFLPVHTSARSSREAQQQEILRSTLEFLRRFDDAPDPAPRSKAAARPTVPPSSALE